jgi:hypothetical protein
VYQPAAPSAVARRNQRVALRLLAAQAHLAAALALLQGLVVLLEVFFDFEDAVGLFEVVGVPNGFCFVLVLGLDDHVLDSTELDDVSGFYMNGRVLRGYPVVEVTVLLNSRTTR